jgi:hypothetical protein
VVASLSTIGRSGSQKPGVAVDGCSTPWPSSENRPVGPSDYRAPDMGRYRAGAAIVTLRLWVGVPGVPAIYGDESLSAAASKNQALHMAASSALTRILSAASTSARCGLVRDGAVVSAATPG